MIELGNRRRVRMQELIAPGCTGNAPHENLSRLVPGDGPSCSERSIGPGFSAARRERGAARASRRFVAVLVASVDHLDIVETFDAVSMKEALGPGVRAAVITVSRSGGDSPRRHELARSWPQGG